MSCSKVFSFWKYSYILPTNLEGLAALVKELDTFLIPCPLADPSIEWLQSFHQNIENGIWWFRVFLSKIILMSSGNKFATSEEDRTKRHKTVDDIASRSMNQPLTSRGWRPKRFIKEEGTQTPLITQHTRCFQLWPYGCCLNLDQPKPLSAETKR